MRPSRRFLSRLLTFALTGALTLALALAARTARAQPPDPELMARLALHAAAIDRMRTHACYLLEGEMESLDGDGKVDGIKKILGRVEGDGERARFFVVRYTEDGKDKADDMRKQTKESNDESKEDRAKKHIEMPFVAAAQPHYVFDQVAVDTADPSRVQISFVPREPSEHTSEGSVWVDTKAGTILTAGFKLSKPGFFVDYVHITMEFGAKTELGPAISRITLDGKGGILFIRKRFRGWATLSDYTMTP